MAGGAGKSSSKRPRRSNNDSAVVVDRLSGLSDNILHHILSFFDTKLMVQTSILSRRWRSVWKEVTTLNFDTWNLPDQSKFEQHVDKLLSLRSNSAAISSLTLDHWRRRRLKGKGADELFYDQLFDRIMKHAAATHDSPRLHHLSIRTGGLGHYNRNLADLIWAHGHHASLKTLKLEDVNLEYCHDGTVGTVLALGFKALTTLELCRCKLVPTQVKSLVVDPFASLPRLKYLKLHYWEHVRSCLLRVSGLELLDLQIEDSHEYSMPQKIEVFAPKLESFCFLGGTEQLGELNFPSRAYTKIDAKQPPTAEDDDFDEDYDMKWRPPPRAAEKY